eukprot:scaffold14179_cov155-Skeletonema_dohrnii-CCMP3373.AAC.5
MPNPKKKQRLVGPADSGTAATAAPLRRSRRINGKPNATIAQADVVVEHIFGYLPPEDIMRSRRVCKRWKDAAKNTIVPIPTTRFEVDTVLKYSAMAAMSTAMPNLAQITIRPLEYRIRYSNGEEPNQSLAANTINRITFVTLPETISRFRKLRVLELDNAPLNGRYPFLFDFPILESLVINNCYYLKWDLEMLRGMPLLKTLCAVCNGKAMTGNIKSLRALKNTLEKVTIVIESRHSANVVGNFMDLADFPRLKQLDLGSTSVTGDIRDIEEQDFSVLKGHLNLPKTVVGGDNYKFLRISEVSELVAAVDRIRKQRDATMFEHYSWSLANDSPDMYSMDHLDAIDYPPPPFTIQFIRRSSRFGWCWKNICNNCCEVNWLDPEPDRTSDYERYTQELVSFGVNINLFKGYHQPPTQEEYRNLCEEHHERRLG